MSTEVVGIGNEFNQMVCFAVAKEEFAVDIMKVQEIIKMPNITRVPNSPEFLEGIITLRGVVIPVIDFKKRFGVPDIGESKESEKRIVVVDISGKTIGLTVDKVTQVVKLDASQISQPPELLRADKMGHISGIGQTPDSMLIILETEALVSEEYLVGYKKAA
jgi:purine-binding chemotaxis protein CheW